MKTVTAGIVAGILCASSFVVPAGLSAKEKRGAEVIVAKLYGNVVKGELISVQSDSIRLLRGRDILTIPRANIHSVQILRRSKKGSGTLIGFLNGATIGVMWGLARGPDAIHGHPALIAGPIAGGVGALIGFLASPWARVDSTFAFSGVPDLTAAENWAKLRAHSRERRPKGFAQRP